MTLSPRAQKHRVWWGRGGAVAATALAAAALSQLGAPVVRTLAIIVTAVAGALALYIVAGA